MFLGNFNIGETVRWYCNTHDPLDDGRSSDADFQPLWRIYNDSSASAIVTGSMVKLDNANTVGFYYGSQVLSTGVGFANGQYTVYISAQVTTITGTMHHMFRIGEPADLRSVSGSEQIDGVPLGTVFERLLGNSSGKWHLNPTGDTLTIYKQDKATALVTFNLTSTAATPQ
jgi:hypothetical protein